MWMWWIRPRNSCGCSKSTQLSLILQEKSVGGDSFCPELCWLWCFRSLSLTNNQSQALQMTFLCRIFIGHCWFKKYRYSGHFLLHIIVRIGEIVTNMRYASSLSSLAFSRSPWCRCKQRCLFQSSSLRRWSSAEKLQLSQCSLEWITTISLTFFGFISCAFSWQYFLPLRKFPPTLPEMQELPTLTFQNQREWATLGEISSTRPWHSWHRCWNFHIIFL